MNTQHKYLRESSIRAEGTGLLPMSRTTFRKLIAEGKLPRPALLIGKCSYWLESEVLAAIDKLAEEQLTAPQSFPTLKHQRAAAPAK